MKPVTDKIFQHPNFSTSIDYKVFDIVFNDIYFFVWQTMEDSIRGILTERLENETS